MKILPLLLFFASVSYGATAYENALADSIYRAEGGSHTAHPYGIMKTYRHTTPRQACLNTIHTNIKAWNGRGDFIDFMADKYCPYSADPIGNTNWKRNVRYFMNRKHQPINPL